VDLSSTASVLPPKLFLDPLDDLESSFHVVDDDDEEDVHIAAAFVEDERAETHIMDILSNEQYRDSACVFTV